MKLHSKIILICILTVVTSLILISILACLFLTNSYRNDEIINSYQKTTVLIDNIRKNIDIQTTDSQDGYLQQSIDKKNYNRETKSKEETGDELYGVQLNYYIKNFFHESSENYTDFGCICVLRNGDENVEVFNNTIFAADQIGKNKTERYALLENYTLKREGQEYVVFTTKNSTYWSAPFEIYCIDEIGGYRQKINKIAIVLLAGSAIVVLAEVIILLILLRRIFNPLKELNEKANDIANNVYDKRIEIKTKDEIGMLGKSFNRMADAVEMYTKHLEDMEKRKTLFMGNLTHELKTPMTAMSGYSQLLLTAKLNEEDREEALMYINDECNRLSGLSNKMMHLLGLEENNFMELRNIEVEKLFEEALKTCNVVAREKEIEIIIEPTEMMLKCDKDLMIEVLINLIDNAIKASKSGDVIILTAKDNEIAVIDQGYGIPKEEQDKIMEPFYMVDKSRTRKSGGAGLGLALAVEILKKHNMKIKIESEIGKGTKVILQFV